MAYSRTRDGNIWKGLAAGIASGLLASWVMNKFQAELAQLENGGKKKRSSGGEDATIKTADRVSRGELRHDLAFDATRPLGHVIDVVGGECHLDLGEALNLPTFFDQRVGERFRVVAYPLGEASQYFGALDRRCARPH